ncbi:MAG: hypothetical protein IPK83_14740 [Planctomycetes bacterium]|nr:hypothetical protein [Planctomycetota bacterium]
MIDTSFKQAEPGWNKKGASTPRAEQVAVGAIRILSLSDELFRKNAGKLIGTKSYDLEAGVDEP